MRNHRLAYAVATLGLASTLALAQATKPAKPDDKKPSQPTIEIRNLNFYPEELTIKVGETVKWINNDNRDCVILCDAADFRSENLRPKESCEHKFTEAGKYEYRNILRPRTTGTIIVKE